MEQRKENATYHNIHDENYKIIKKIDNRKDWNLDESYKLYKVVAYDKLVSWTRPDGINYDKIKQIRTSRNQLFLLAKMS